MSHRYHLPPSVHTTFLGNRFVVCTFVPRPFETDPGAIKIPFFHNNDDYDEVIFYHAGDFFSRDNIHPGMVTLHPGGFTHGPHPKALSRMLVQSKPATDEYAVMVTRATRSRSRRAAGVEWAGYVEAGRPRQNEAGATLARHATGRLAVVSRDLRGHACRRWRGRCRARSTTGRQAACARSARATNSRPGARGTASSIRAGAARALPRATTGWTAAPREPRRTRAQGAGCDDAGVVLDRSARLPGRFG
jgi:hypothetical protein